MNWEHEEWSVGHLIELCDSEKMNLSPDYQRNPIWTSKAQKLLIDTILRPEPIPNFFVRKLGKGQFEMVDGQQRARSIRAFHEGQITTSDGVAFRDLAVASTFLDYPLNITLITALEKTEEIERFYALVNSSGLRLNTPELRKAKYHDTRFLALCNELAGSEPFAGLGLFGAGTVSRMNDVELVAELVSLLKFGITEKKGKVDELFEGDITESEATELRSEFGAIAKKLAALDTVRRLKKTRFKQRADLYTLFDFVKRHREVPTASLKCYYRILLQVAPGIRPTQEDCVPLRDYARNCVSQSNSMDARRQRTTFLESLLRNPKPKPNDVQQAIAGFLGADGALVEVSGAWTLGIGR